jgi:hypothetical protein
MKFLIVVSILGMFFCVSFLNQCEFLNVCKFLVDFVLSLNMIII